MPRNEMRCKRIISRSGAGIFRVQRLAVECAEGVRRGRMLSLELRCGEERFTLLPHFGVCRLECLNPCSPCSSGGNRQTTDDLHRPKSPKPFRRLDPVPCVCA
ncbi:hypothetical protein J6590_017875 [Homalodisca vitripennis]|nr:hypothetical protein J6590_017875 [Homalodisca vitripennis]